MYDWPTVSSQIPAPSLIAAWARLGMAPSERLPLWAAHWLAAGHEGDALVALAAASANDDPRDLRALLPGALADCGVAVPDSDTAAAQLTFTQVARLYADGLAGERWVLDKVYEIAIHSGYADPVLALPLGTIWRLADEWGAGWGRSQDDLRPLIGEACAAQLAASTSQPLAEPPRIP